MDESDRVAALEADYRLVAHRLDAIDGRLETLSGQLGHVSERLDAITRLQEADVRHNENIQRALAEIAELRKDSREEAAIQRVRWDSASRDSDERWARYITERSDIRSRLDSDIHGIERRLSWFAGVLAVAQIVLGIVAWVYTSDLSRIGAENTKQDAHLDSVSSHVTDNTQRLTAIEAALRQHLKEDQQ